jgi:hypothetical protein
MAGRTPHYEAAHEPDGDLVPLASSRPARCAGFPFRELFAG